MSNLQQDEGVTFLRHSVVQRAPLMLTDQCLDRHSVNNTIQIFTSQKYL